MGAIRIERDPGGCVEVRLENPGRRNALDDAMLDGLLRELPQLARDPSCRMLLLEGAGEDFCPGRDLSGLDVDTRSDDELRGDFDRARRLASEMLEFPKPIVAVVRGYALGLGLALVGWSDIAVAAEDAKLGFPEVKVGLPPSFTCISVLGRVAPKAALQLLLTGATINGREAERIGLITKAVPVDEVEAWVARTVADILAASPTAICLAKSLVRSRMGPQDEALEQALQTTLQGIRTPDALEGRRAFRERRKPNFSGLAGAPAQGPAHV